MKYVSLDIETTGLDPIACQIIEIAAVINVDGVEVKDCPSFHRLVTNYRYNWEPIALKMNWKLAEKLINKDNFYSYTPEEQLAGELWSWLSKNFGDEKSFIKEKITFAGKNFASFDRQFLRYLTGSSHLMDFMHHRSLDPGSMYWNPSDKVIPDFKTCIERAGLEYDAEKHHNALWDAQTVIALIRKFEENRQAQSEAAKQRWEKLVRGDAVSKVVLPEGERP